MSRALLTNPLLGGLPFSQLVASLNPIGWYKLDESSGTVAFDSSTNGNDADYLGPFALQGIKSRPGAATNGVLLDNFANVNVPYFVGTPLDVNASDHWTIHFWCRPTNDTAGSSLKALVSSRYSDFGGWANYIISLGWNSLNMMQLTVTNDGHNGATGQAQDPGALVVDTTYCVSVRRNGGTLDIFKDDVLVDSDAWTGTGASGTNPGFEIGGGGTFPTVYEYIGGAQDVVLFDYALSDATLSQLYAKGLTTP